MMSYSCVVLVAIGQQIGERRHGAASDRDGILEANVTEMSPDRHTGVTKGAYAGRPILSAESRRLMHLYLIRHAHAEDGNRDALRPLSEKGQRQIRNLCRCLRKQDAVEVEEFWHSPFRRAAQTAAQFTHRLRLPARLVEVGGLKPQDDPKAIVRRLSQMEFPVAIVGHDPHLSALASLLVTGSAEPPHFMLKKCAVLRLDRDGANWCVRWLVSPEVV